eukprot:16333286-Heterocapsa_arctica.AAC.1
MYCVRIVYSLLARQLSDEAPAALRASAGGPSGPAGRSSAAEARRNKMAKVEMATAKPTIKTARGRATATLYCAVI